MIRDVVPLVLPALLSLFLSWVSILDRIVIAIVCSREIFPDFHLKIGNKSDWKRCFCLYIIRSPMNRDHTTSYDSYILQVDSWDWHEKNLSPHDQSGESWEIENWEAGFLFSCQTFSFSKLWQMTRSGWWHTSQGKSYDWNRSPIKYSSSATLYSERSESYNLRTWSVPWREGVSTHEQTPDWTCLVGATHPLDSSHLAIWKSNWKMTNQTLKRDPQKKIFCLDERLLIICWPSNGINKMAGTHLRFFPTRI